MELFLDFIFTIAFSLIFSFFLAKLLSAATTDDPQHDFTKKKTDHYHKFQEFLESVDDQVFTQQETSNDQRLELSRGEVEKEEGKSPDEVQKTEIDMGLIKEEVGVEEKEDIEIIKSCEFDSDEKMEEEDGDWEGIERSEIQKLFGVAVAYVGSIGKISTDLKLQLYGLHQIAMEGPCNLPQPMALKLSARAKWNAWQQLGNMSQEAAMEQYINLLSRRIPGWMEDTLGEDVNQEFTHDDASINTLSDSVLVERYLEEQKPHVMMKKV
ncbi:acyl-CoA-binding domain-containing protein 3-like [Euphorbia lathyris]|uniref:acyl-CoA-binding domain-containing protein 3-like n=1 Tax=Euphorbia lathyris TaxID=212925 RepID=UPI003313F3EC